MQKKVKLFLRLIRFYQPTGFFLLMWPAICAAFLASKTFPSYTMLLLLVSGSFLIRSAGCIINDIADKDFDKHVARTKNRPLASGELKVSEAVVYLFVLLLCAFIILINFNRLTIIIGFISLIPIAIYPHMKKYTYFPQVFLGFTFNLGAILSYVAICNRIDICAVIFYLACVFWTLGYDTIYAYQDIVDDKKLGLKSTAIRLKDNPKIYIFIFYAMFMLLTGVALILSKINGLKLLFLLLPLTHIGLQLKRVDPEDPAKCGKIFRSNGLTGLLLLISFVLMKL
jgi:4-hydroxybenzoate polyprenyltransferase